MKGIRLVVALLAALLILGSSFALAALGDQAEGSEPSEPQESVGVELPAKRTETSSTYQLPDGALETRIYGTPINYETTDGAWKRIDGSLEEQPDGAGLTNGANAFDLSLPEKMGAAPVRLSMDGAWVSARLLSAPTEALELQGDAATYEAGDSEVTFALAGLANGLKEDIRLAGPSAPSSFHFLLEASAGAIPVVAANGSVEFRDQGDEVVSVMPAPVMSDSADPPVISKAVHYSLSPQGEGAWKLTVEASPDWLKEPERAWPVTIDPTLTVGLPPTMDCNLTGGINETLSGFCGGTGWHRDSAYAWYKTTEYGRSILYYDLKNAVPKTASVTSATLKLFSQYTAENTSGVELLKVTEDWAENVSWKNKWCYLGTCYPWSTPGGSFSAGQGAEVSTASRGTQPGFWEFPVTLLAQGWVNNSIPNKGAILKLKDEMQGQCGPTYCANRTVIFDSSAVADTSHRPHLSVTYHSPASPDSKVSSPVDGTRSAKRFKLQAAWDHGGVSGVYFEYKNAEGIWTEVPTSKVINAKNETAKWPLLVGPGDRKSPVVYWNAVDAASSEYVQKRQIRAILVGSAGADGYTQPVNVELNRKTGGTKDASTSVGPGSVNLLTGNFTVGRTDISIPSFGSALEFTRTHNSRDVSEAGDKTVLGRGWKPGAPVEAAGGAAWRGVRHVVPSVQEQEEGFGEYALLTDLEGYEYAFELVGGAFVAPPEATGFTLSHPTGSTFVFSDPGGNSTTFENVGGGSEYVPVSVSQTGGNKTRLVYDIIGGNRRLRTVVAPTPPGMFPACDEGSANVEGCQLLTFTYQPASKWGAPASFGDRLEAITYHGANGMGKMGHWIVASYSYDSQGRLSAAWDPRISPALKETYSYKAEGQLGTITPPGQEPWTLEYGTSEEVKADGRLISVKRPSLLASPSVAQTTIAYGVPLSGSGLPDMSPSSVGEWGQKDLPADATAIFPPDQVPASPPSSYSRASIYYLDAEGQQVNVATPAGAGTSAASITTTETDEHSNVTRELTAQNRLRALAAGSESVTRSNELETRRFFSADGTEMQEELGPLHQVRLESGATAQARLRRSVQYDKGWPETGVKPHLPTLETTAAYIPGQGTDVDQRTTETKYDWSLRKPIETIVAPETEGLKLKTRLAYDPTSGLPTERSLPAAPGGGDAHTTKITYYKLQKDKGAPLKECETTGAWINLPCKTFPAGQPGTPGQPELLVTKYVSYSPLGQPTKVVESPGGSTQNTRTKITEYDAAGRPTQSEVQGGGVAIPIIQTVYSTSQGMPVEKRIACQAGCETFDNQAVATSYDTLGRPTGYSDADGGQSTATYDLLGRPVTTSDGKGTQTRSYDPTSGLLVQLEDSAAGTFTAAYDADGNVVAQGLPNGLAANTTYDETGASIHLTYDKVTNCSIDCTWLDFDAERSITGQILAEKSMSSSQQYSYDKAGRLTLVKDTPSGGACTTRSYSYDADSNRTALVTRAPGIGGACDTTSTGTPRSYEYDAGDRLVGEGLTYDGFGRITSLPSKYAGGGTLTTSFYSNDMIASQSQDGLTNSYQLDATMRPREVVQSGSKSGTEVFHYSGGSDSPAWASKGSTWTRNITGIGGELAAIQESTGETKLQLANLHGDVMATASPSPTATKLLSSFEYDEFGNPKSGNAGRFGWLGGKQRRTELPSGVVQMGVRSYVPDIGRFISVDPVAGGSANAYDYADADPVNGFDLAGTCSGKRCRRAAKRSRATARVSTVTGQIVRSVKRLFDIVAPIAWGTCVPQSAIGPDRQAVDAAFGKKSCIPKVRYDITSPVQLPAAKALGLAWCIATNAWAREPVHGVWRSHCNHRVRRLVWYRRTCVGLCRR